MKLKTKSPFNKSKVVLKHVLIILLGLQSIILFQSFSDILQIELISGSLTLVAFSSLLIINKPIVETLKVKSLETLFYMNTTVFLSLVIFRERTYNMIGSSLGKVKGIMKKTLYDE